MAEDSSIPNRSRVTPLVRQTAVYTGRIARTVLHGCGFACQLSGRVIVVSSTYVVTEVRKMHRRQNLAKVSVATFCSNAVGLGLGMLSAQLATSFLDTRRPGNLWGIISRKEIVTENQLIMAEFVIELLITLVVFSITTHYLEEFKAGQAARRGLPEREDAGPGIAFEEEQLDLD